VLSWEADGIVEAEGDVGNYAGTGMLCVEGAMHAVTVSRKGKRIEYKADVVFRARPVRPGLSRLAAEYLHSGDPRDIVCFSRPLLSYRYTSGI
jgi:hypothetical protein